MIESKRNRLLGYGLGFVVSLALHAGFLWLMEGQSTSLPVALRRPIEIEFGVVTKEEPPPEQVSAKESPPQKPKPKPKPKPKAPPPKEEVAAKPKPKPDPEPKAVVVDAAPAEEPESETSQVPSEPTDAPEDSVPRVARFVSNTEAGPFSDYAPPGSQIAVRLDVTRIRETALASDVERLLEVLPDWQAVAGGSGIRALEDLERLYIATPDLVRSSVIVAGKYAPEDALPERAVETLAQKHGKPAPWVTKDGVATAPWHNPDRTPRIVALVGPQEFVITRPDDLPRVLQVARALALRREEAEQGGKETPGEETPAEPAEEGAEETETTTPPKVVTPEEAMASLLALDEGHLLSLTVEGVEQFVIGGGRSIPERLQVAVGLSETGSLELEARGFYTDSKAAKYGAIVWHHEIRKLGDHSLAFLMGFRAPLHAAKVNVEEDTVTITASLEPHLAKLLLGLIRDSIAPPKSSKPKRRPTAQPDAKPVAPAVERQSIPPAPPN